MSQAPDTTIIKTADVLEAAADAARLALDPAAKVAPAAPPPDLMQIVSEAVAVYAAAKAGGKDWWKSRGMWGALGSIVGGLSVLVLPAIHAPVLAYTAAGVATVFCGVLSGKGRMSAVGPIK